MFSGRTLHTDTIVFMACDDKEVELQFELDAEQNALKDSVSRLLETHAGEAALSNILAGGPRFDQTTWKRLAEQVGAQGICIPDNCGGNGASAVETTIIMEEMGRRCYSGPYFSNLAATHALMRGGNSEFGGHLEAIAAGDDVLTFAIVDETATWHETSFSVRAERGDEGYLLSGTKLYVTDPAVATHMVVAATTLDGVALFLVQSDSAGVEVELDNGLDLARELGHVNFTEASGELICVGTVAIQVLDELTNFASLALAAEMVGSAEECLTKTVSWSKERVQFGRPIGSFQVIKSKCADTLLEIETARVIVYYAAYCLESQAADVSTLVSLAKQAATDCSLQAAGELIQTLGAIGFTWEHPAHLYLRRARSNGVLLQDRNFHLDRVADQICV